LQLLLEILTRIATRFSRRAWLWTCVVVGLGLNAAFIWRRSVVGVQLLDGRGWYSPADVANVFTHLAGNGNLELYRRTELTLDLLYPVVYTALFLGLINRLLPEARKRLLIPVAAFVCDIGENLLIANLAASWDGSTPAASIVTLASSFTLAKWTATALSLFVVLDGVVRRLAAPPQNVPGFVAFADVKQRELEYVALRRRHHPGRPGDPGETLIGLALSGGGIRAATTSLGILQGLSRMRILPLVDYVSTVSGGGYIGACLSSLLSLPQTNQPNEPFFSTEWASFPFNPTHREGRTQIDHLRTHGSFLITRTGLLARETMRSLGQLLSGTVYHLATTFLGLVVIAWLYMAVVFTVSPKLHDTLTGRTPVQFLREDPVYERFRPLDSERNVFRNATVGERIQHKAGLLRAAAWQAGNTTHGRWGVAVSILFGVVLTLASFIYFRARRPRRGQPPNVTAQSGESEDDAEERGLLRRIGGYGTAAAVAVFFTAWWSYRLYDDGVLWLFLLPMAFLSAMVTAFLIHVCLPRFPDNWNRRTRSLWGAFQAMAAYGFWVALLLALLPLATYSVHETWAVTGVSVTSAVSLIAARLLASRESVGIGSWRLPNALRNFLLGAAIAAAAILGLVAITAAIVPDGDMADALRRFWISALSVGGLLLALGWLVDANRVSPHYFYQDRLGETYLFTEARNRLTGVLFRIRNSVNMRLRELHGREPQAADQTRAGTAPYHLVSAAINLAGSRDLTRKDRKSGYFLFSRYFCGSTHTGFLRSELYEQGDTRLARAITISGAAASSAIGMGTFFAQAFATVLFNLRLGYWMPHPAKQSARLGRTGWYFWPRWLAREMFMRTDDRAALVNLSDGGHTGDNVGIYPLLQRRCRVIIAVDAEKDPNLAFGSLTEALRHAYIDLGIDVDIDFTMLRPDPKTGMSRSHCAVGLIRYPPPSRFGRQEELPSMASADVPGERDLIGYLIYLKNSLTGDEPEPVLNYKADHPAFPHETTVDQFFDDDQFESYRALGVHIAEDSLGRWIHAPEFERFRQQFWPFR